MRVVPVIVQADLAHGAAFRMPKERGNLFQALGGKGVKLLRVYSRGKPDPVLPLRQRGGLPAALGVAARIEHTVDAALHQPGQQLIPVFVKGRIVQMGMGVKIHRFSSFGTAAKEPAPVFTRVPS